jgi:hypothetical protein
MCYPTIQYRGYSNIINEIECISTGGAIEASSSSRLMERGSRFLAGTRIGVAVIRAHTPIWSARGTARGQAGRIPWQ